MTIKNLRWERIIIPTLIAAVFAACSTTLPHGIDSSVTAQESQQAMGAELWANNCQRCHNFRDPSSLSDAQWEVVLMHMRIRANLTAEEHRSILEYLKSSND